MAVGFLRKLLQGQHQGVGAFLAVALGLGGDIKLVHQGQPRQGQVHPPSLFQGDAHVLDEVLDEEPGVEVAFDDAGREVVERPAAGRPRADRLDAHQRA